MGGLRHYAFFFEFFEEESHVLQRESSTDCLSRILFGGRGGVLTKRCEQTC